ncbi:carbon storage regulator [Rhodopirellula sp. SWK7]|uniref:carbon storage regulator n=1 Tax=Rhodopirellula sp. SWK7 TaxID=595460 RepID=UPI0002BE7110|nr:carbon storage regulator [Rhodopirellula sp. SWK7]EMI43064.1 Carbon storage regulator [Rhodopirellula sp. SWK7]
MLVLTRKLNEQIKIGNDITITVIKLRNNQIRLGIDAPRDVRVLRAELGESVADAIVSADAAQNAKAKANDSEASKANAATTPTNRVRTFLNVAEVVESSEGQSGEQGAIRNDVVDGLMSADEMIAAGKDIDDEKFDNDCESGGNDSPQSSIQLFSGTIGRDGTIRENIARDRNASRGGAPLAAFFTAP